MYDAAKEAILNSSPESSVYVGADSQRYKKNGKWFARYSVVIVLHVDSKHGCKIFSKIESIQDYGNLKQRLLTEVMYAIEAANEIIDVLGDRQLHIHLDLNSNPNHKSNIAVKEALGYVKGATGIDADIKPNAWAATHCADHMVRH